MKKLLIRVIVYLVKFYPNHHINKRMAVCESNGRYDNGWALFRYLIEERKDLKPIFRNGYQYIDRDSYPNYSTKYIITNSDNCFSKTIKKIRKMIVDNSAAAYFYTQVIYLPTNKKAKCVYLGHGTGLKKAPFYTNPIYSTGIDIVYSTKEYYELHKKHSVYNNNNIVFCGHPRSDLCVENEHNKTLFNNLIGKNNNEKVVLVVTTFRMTSNGPSYSRVLPDFINLKELNCFLKDRNMKMVIKLHHVFDKIPIDSSVSDASNIVWLKNKDVVDNMLELNSIIPYADAYISDYSGAASDIMLGDKPIAFFIDDLDSFASNPKNGFIVDNPLDYMPGDLVKNDSELFSFLNDIYLNKDVFVNERHKISMIFNGFEKPSLNCCKTIINLYFSNDNK